MVGSDEHEIQFWEARRELQIIASAKELYEWLIEMLENRPANGNMPTNTPPTFTEIEVKATKRGSGGSILFASKSNMANSIEEMPVTVKIEYQDGFAVVGIPDRETSRQLAHEFGTLIPDWGMRPWVPVARDYHGRVQHKVVNNWNPDDPALDVIFGLPPRIQEDNARGTEINLRIDQLDVLEYWAQAGQEASVGVAFNASGHAIEYWLPITIDPSPNEGGRAYYLEQLKMKWMEKVMQMAPWIAQK
jgi:hypothetical protein